MTMSDAAMFVFNYLNNLNFNNMREFNKILKISMVARHYRWR
jgi:hypothetical protein